MKNHQKFSVIYLLLFFFLVSCTGQVNQLSPTPDANVPRTTLRFAIDPNLAPFESRPTKDASIIGFDVDLINAISARANINIELVDVKNGFNLVLSSVENCTLDGGISAIPVSDSIKGKMLLSDPYYSTQQVISIKKGNIKITSFATLTGMTVGAQADSPAITTVLQNPSITSIPFTTYFLAFQDLTNANIDAVVSDQPHALEFAKFKPNNLKIVPDNGANIDFAIAICNNHPEVLKAVNDALASLKTDGTLGALVKKWPLPQLQP